MAQQQFLRGKLYRFTGTCWDQRMGRNQPYDVIAIGEVVRNRIDIIIRTSGCKGEFVPDDKIYRLDDGHLPDHQPRVTGHELRGHMGPHKILFAFPDLKLPA